MACINSEAGCRHSPPLSLFRPGIRVARSVAATEDIRFTSITQQQRLVEPPWRFFSTIQKFLERLGRYSKLESRVIIEYS